MLTSLLETSTIPLLEQVISFTQARHGVLAGNIANVDTPGYRARDLSPEAFRERLRAAVDSSRPREPSTLEYNAHLAGLMPRTTSADRTRPSGLQANYDKIRGDMQGMLRHDDNDTSLERQVTEIAKNQAQHNLALTIMNQQHRLLRTIVSERL
ncbi:MAG: flagellar basal body rod protein FlgB [Pirellulales bacterium]|nr:flagellar basal body rod protein FlgB [Pirellulales bacterium]